MSNTDTKVLVDFMRRIKKLNIDIELVGNYPWIYINKINGKRVTERFHANHGFTIAFLPIRDGQKMELTDISEIFQLIRKYLKETVTQVDTVQ